MLELMTLCKNSGFVRASKEAARKREFWDAPAMHRGDPVMLPCVTRIAAAPLGNPFEVAEVR